MKVYNMHERLIGVSPARAGTALDSLSGTDDVLWPRDRWPAMEFEVPLGEGAAGGHGPVRYTVTEYVPGRRVVFQFNGQGLTAGLDGRHFFEIVPRREHVVFRHVVDAECDFKTWLKWRMIVGPLHDALLEDALGGVAGTLIGGPGRTKQWTPWVRFLRWMMARKRRKPH
jgi:hypothetical protein